MFLYIIASSELPTIGLQKVEVQHVQSSIPFTAVQQDALIDGQAPDGFSYDFKAVMFIVSLNEALSEIDDLYVLMKQDAENVLKFVTTAEVEDLQKSCKEITEKSYPDSSFAIKYSVWDYHQLADLKAALTILAIDPIKSTIDTEAYNRTAGQLPVRLANLLNAVNGVETMYAKMNQVYEQGKWRQIDHVHAQMLKIVSDKLSPESKEARDIAHKIYKDSYYPKPLSVKWAVGAKKKTT